jgi:glucokinase
VRSGQPSTLVGGEEVERQIAFGLDVGGTKVLGLALDGSGEVLVEGRVPTPVVHDPSGYEKAREELLDSMATLATQLCERAGFDPAAHGVSPCVGVGVPGLVDDSGILRFAPNLPVGTGVDFASVLEGRLRGWHIAVDNDATCAVVAESTRGAASGASDAVMVTLGTGIGGGIISGGRVLRGVNGFAGELGHMVVDPSGPVCPCGRRGCWERYASGSGLGRLAREAAHAGRLGKVVNLAGGDPEAVRGEHVTQSASNGDTEARAVLEELGWWLALGLANLTNILDTGTFVVGGGMVEAIRIVLGSVRSSFAQMMEERHQRPEVQIVLARLGERAGAIGAALVARQGDRYRVDTH